MALKVTKRDGTGERSVLIGMVVSKTVLGQIAHRWEPPGLFPSRAANLIGGWCVEHYHRHRVAPGRDIVGYFDRWAAATDRDPETVAAIETLLSGLSDEHARLKNQFSSPDYVIDLASRLFNRHRLAELRSAIDGDLARGDNERAESRVSQFRRIELGTGSYVDVLSDDADADFESAFDQKVDVLVRYPDAAGEFFGHSLCRDGFIAFMGKEKVGKSRWVFDVAWRGLEQGRNVAYFQLGDLSKNQELTERLAVRLCGRPLLSGRWAYPISMDASGRGLPDVGLDIRDAERPLAASDVRAARRELRERIGDTVGNRWRMTAVPAGSLSMTGVNEILAGWERDDWIPDVVALDYADIMAPIDRRADKLEQIHDTWMAMRALSQRMHCLVVTATQTNRAGFDVRTLRREHVGGDHRKLAEVTGMVGINQMPEEKEYGLYRLNWVVQRTLDFGETTCLWTASCLAINDPCLFSSFQS